MAQIRIPTLLLCVLIATLAGISRQQSATESPPANTTHPPPSPSPNQCYIDRIPRCGFCGRNIDVTITIRNQLVEPNFEHSITVTNKPKRELIFFLTEAADANGVFKFESTYYSNLGFFIDSFNELRGSATQKIFWHIINVNGVGSLDCGVSSFLPNHGDVILFNYTTWAAAGFDY